MKIQSFALQSKSSLKAKPRCNNGSSSRIKSEQFNPVFVSEFDPSKSLFSDTKNKIVVPPKDDELRPHKRMKNMELPPLHSGNKPLDFELEEAENFLDGGTSYGLNLRENYGGGGSSVAIMMRRFKSDLETLPEEQGLDEYEDTPVDGFGEAVSMGYSWKEGKEIKKNANDDVKIVEFKKWCAREGFGFGYQPVGKEVRVDEFAKLRSVRRESRRKREDEVDDVVVKTKHERVEKQEKNGGENKVMWVRNHIRVRIISKLFKGGKFYSKKGMVVDVIGPGICDISVDDGGGILQAVDQDILETALPHRGGYVLVLLGEHKGVYGKLVEKDTKRETGVVQDVDTQEMFKVWFEEIAEYLGDPSYLGY